MSKLDKSLVVKRNSIRQKLQRVKELIKPPLTVVPLSDTVEVLRDIHVPLNDQQYLSVNIYKPRGKVNLPALLCLHPYDKDKLAKPGQALLPYRLIRQTDPITFSQETSWEAPDPEFWVANGYAVVNIDKRGFGKSPGSQALISDAEADDYYQVIEWVAAQSWSNTKVGLLGVSYLAISQYKVAQLNPPHLAAICPWEGFTDIYADAFYPGGIREDGFVAVWCRGLGKPAGPLFRSQQLKHTLRDNFYQAMIPELSQIKVPALICASFSDHQLHSRGSFRAFEQISSPHKWLYSHRGGKWATFYSAAAKQMQLMFFDCFLKGVSQNILQQPRVTIEVREFANQITNIRYGESWPLPNTQWQELFLQHANSSLQPEPTNDHTNNYNEFDLTRESLKFRYTFNQDCEVIGPFKLTLFVSLTGVSDANLFIGLQKFHNGQEVSFEGSYGFANDVVSKGFMKVSCREVNSLASKPYLPEHGFSRAQPLALNEIVCLEISLLPAATLFRAGDQLQLVIQGKPLLAASKLDQIGDYEASQPGRCLVYASDNYPSKLVIPCVNSAD